MENTSPKIVFVGTFPPTDEGIATFNEDLVTATQKMLGRQAICQVAAINLRDTSPYYFDQKVRWEIDQDILKMYTNTAEDINSDESIKHVIVQHEYGIYGGEWGMYINEFLKAVNKPVILIMHSVLETHPYKAKIFKQVTDELVANSTKIVVLSKKSKEILSQLYPNQQSKIHFIPHGIHPVKFTSPKAVKKELHLSSKTVLTTFGLLSRDKGIEYVLRSLPEVVKEHPSVLYQVLGQTHPIVRRSEGEKYRTELVNEVKKLGLRQHVRFVDKYMSLNELLKYLQGTDIYIATSVNKDQAVSGTFSYALGTGRVVISTEFTQAKEMINKNIGRLVKPKDVKSYTYAILDLLKDRKALAKYNKKAYSKTRSMLWTNVAKEYIDIINTNSTSDRIGFPSLNLSHLRKLTKSNGLIQFAKYDMPDEKSGYTLDDNARALILTTKLKENGYDSSGVTRLHSTYWKFVKHAASRSEGCLNYYNIEVSPTKQNLKENPQEHQGRALWALSEVISSPTGSAKSKGAALRLWGSVLENTIDFTHLRPKALFIKAAAIVFITKKDPKLLSEMEKFANDILDSYHKEKEKNWLWFEKQISYNNAILPEALALTYIATKDKKYLKVAEKTFNFLISKTFMGDVYVPIGQRNWYQKGKKRSLYDQQPEDAGNMVLGLLTMYKITKKKKYLKYAKYAFSWFLGNNLNGLPLYNYSTHGVYDGLQENGVNKNQGAESLVSYLLARVEIEKYK